MNGECCTTASWGQEFPGAPTHDSDCPHNPDREEKTVRYDDEHMAGAGGWPSGGGGGAGGGNAITVTHRIERLPQMPRCENADDLLLNQDWLLPYNWRDSMRRFRTEGGLSEAMLAWLIAVAVARPGLDPESRFRYFCGCCWTTIRGPRRPSGVGITDDRFADREERYLDDGWRDW